MRQTRVITIGSRGSQLALCQTQHIVNRLQDFHHQFRFAIKRIRTKGDELDREPSSCFEGKRDFVRELEAAGEAGIPIFLSRAGSMLTIFFTAQEVIDYGTACSSDLKLYAAYFNEMLRKGIYLLPSQFEAQFVSLAHGDEEIEATIVAARQAFSNLYNMR